MQRHTDHHTSHGEFAHTGLQELTAEITFLEGMGLLEEAVGLVGVREVRRANNHVTNVLSQEAQHLTAGVTGSVAGFLLDEAPVDAGYFSGHEGLVFVRCQRVCLCPLVVSDVAFVAYLTQFGCTVVV